MSSTSTSHRSFPPPPDDDANARHGDVETLRRLTREAFGEITQVRDRVRDLEKSLATERASRATERVRVTARVDLGTTLVGSLVGRAGEAVRRGVGAVATIEAPFPNGDSLVLRCGTIGNVVTSPPPPFGFATASATTGGRAASGSDDARRRDDDASGAIDLGGGVDDRPSSTAPSVVLEKIMFRCRFGDNGWLRVAPLGGEGGDAAATLNPLSKGASLTGLGAKGSSLLAGCRGPAVSASRDFGDGLFGLSGGAFLGEPDVGAGHSGVGPKILAQATIRPGTRAAASLSATMQPRDGSWLWRASTENAAVAASAEITPALPEVPGWPLPALGLSAQGLAAVGDRALVAAWASCSPRSSPVGGGVGRGVESHTDWGFAATAPATSHAHGWGFVFGRAAAANGVGGTSASPPLQCEAFLRVGDEGWGGNSRSVMPGVVVTKDAETGKVDAVVACKVQWNLSA